MIKINQSTGLHGNEAVLSQGNTTNPTKALLLLHGRGASAASIIRLSDNLTVPNEYIVVAPQAADSVWYPERFIVPTQQNQPYLDSALARITAVLESLKQQYNLDHSEITLAGFSQGACLVAEYLKRNPTRYRGATLFSGGLIGDDLEVMENVMGNLEQTPVYIGCDEHDSHIPATRVEQTAEVLSSQNAQVQMKLYQGLGHNIHPDGIIFLDTLLQSPD